MIINKLSDKQLQIMDFIVDDDETIICDGAVRSGKTVIMSYSFVIWAMEYFDHTNFAICGKTVTNAERNILKPLQQIENLKYSLNYKISDRMLTVKCGKKENYFYLFGGKDESSYALIQGLTLAGVLFDEVALMPQSFVDQAIARTLSYNNAKLWFNCNPESPQHWFYKEWIDNKERKYKHLHFLMKDNPILGKDEIERAESLFTGVFYDRYIKGLWVTADGLIYDMFDENKHVKDVTGMTFDRYYISIDYGTQNPTTFLLFGYNNGKWYGIKEYYYSGREKQRQKTDSEFADDLIEFIGDIDYRYIIIDPSAASFIAELRKRNLRIKKANNAVLDGIRLVGNKIQNEYLFLDKSMENTLKEISTYSWDSKAAQHGEDKPVKTNDHSMDAMRYFVSTVLKPNGVNVLK